MTFYTFEVNSKELEINADGAIIWKGKLKGLDVMKLEQTSSGDGCIVLLDWRQAITMATKNVLRIDIEGKVIWEIGKQSETLYGIKREEVETYVDLRRKDNRIYASSASGFLDYINIDTGEIIESIFVK